MRVHTNEKMVKIVKFLRDRDFDMQVSSPCDDPCQFGTNLLSLVNGGALTMLHSQEKSLLLILFCAIHTTGMFLLRLISHIISLANPGNKPVSGSVLLLYACICSEI